MGRNDFYVGIYEDSYLSHSGIKGWVKKGHKYISRLFKGGKWRYIYDAARYSTASHLEDTQGKMLDSTGLNVKGMSYKNYRNAERYGRLAGNAEANARAATLSKKTANRNSERLNRYKAALKRGGQKAQEQYDELVRMATKNAFLGKSGLYSYNDAKRDIKKWMKENDKLPGGRVYKKRRKK